MKLFTRSLQIFPLWQFSNYFGHKKKLDNYITRILNERLLNYMKTILLFFLYIYIIFFNCIHYWHISSDSRVKYNQGMFHEIHPASFWDFNIFNSFTKNLLKNSLKLSVYGFVITYWSHGEFQPCGFHGFHYCLTTIHVYIQIIFILLFIPYAGRCSFASERPFLIFSAV